mmetsp:Transcript_176708/g.566664  ORF Transcript_176708/g.566664 Transcript_176708/m.566664 type:complete len:307 (-) Transcript_176708:3526-4446(-)
MAFITFWELSNSAARPPSSPKPAVIPLPVLVIVPLRLGASSPASSNTVAMGPPPPSAAAMSRAEPKGDPIEDRLLFVLMPAPCRRCLRAFGLCSKFEPRRPESLSVIGDPQLGVVPGEAASPCGILHVSGNSMANTDQSARGLCTSTCASNSCSSRCGTVEQIAKCNAVGNTACSARPEAQERQSLEATANRAATIHSSSTLLSLCDLEASGGGGGKAAFTTFRNAFVVKLECGQHQRSLSQLFANDRRHTTSGSYKLRACSKRASVSRHLANFFSTFESSNFAAPNHVTMSSPSKRSGEGLPSSR